MQRVDAVQQGVALGFGAAVHIHLALQLGGFVVGAQGFQLVDELVAGAGRDDLAGLHGVHQQFELRQLKGAAAQPVAAAPPALQLDVVAKAAQGVDVAVDALALGEDALLLEQLHQLRHVEQMFFVGLLFQNAQQRQKLGFLAFLLGHSNTSGFYLSLLPVGGRC